MLIVDHADHAVAPKVKSRAMSATLCLERPIASLISSPHLDSSTTENVSAQRQI